MRSREDTLNNQYEGKLYSACTDNEIIDAMKEHAIEFAKEINRQGYREYDESNKWINQEATGLKTFTTEQLYDKFGKENNK